MRANLFALFCITLFVLSVPQTFAESDSTAPETAPAETTTETTVVETTSTPVEEPPTAESIETIEAPVEVKETADVESKGDEEVVAEKPPVTAAPETEEKEDGTDEPEPETVATTEDSKETVSEPEPESEPEVVPLTTETTGEGQQGSTEEVVEADGSSDEVAAEQPSEDNTAVAGPEEQTETTAAPTEPTENTDATNAEPATPVSVPEESQQEPAAAEESHETAPVAEGEKGGFSFFRLIGNLLVGVGVLALIILVGCVYNYRYQMRKYKIAPFTPPSFLPECLFPRTTESTGRLVSGYTELQVGNYQAAPRFAEV